MMLKINARDVTTQTLFRVSSEPRCSCTQVQKWHCFAGDGTSHAVDRAINNADTLFGYSSRRSGKLGSPLCTPLFVNNGRGYDTDETAQNNECFCEILIRHETGVAFDARMLICLSRRSR